MQARIIGLVRVADATVVAKEPAVTQGARTVTDGTTMRRWMVAIGIFYLLLGLRLLPWINGAMIEAAGIETVYVGGDVTTDATIWHYLLDWLGVFGGGLLVLGAVLLVASRRPIRNRLFAHLVIWHELIVGVGFDGWFISRDYIPNGVYVGFIAVHLIVIVTGIRALRRTPTLPEVPGEGHRPEAA